MNQADPRLVGADPVVASILTDAFSDDPFMAWIFGPDRAARARSLGVFWGWIVHHAPDDAELWRIGDAAGALWHGPRHLAEAESSADAEPHDEAEPGAEDRPNPFLEMLAPLVGDRLEEVATMLGRQHDLHPQQPYWYLLALGTRAEHQGHGYGARIVRPVLDRCDEQGLVACLESSNPRNIPFYHRLGFEVVGELWTPDGSTVVTGMRREPR